jgi:high affinity Mn2+ porin
MRTVKVWENKIKYLKNPAGIALSGVLFLFPIHALADQAQDKQEDWSIHYQGTVIGEGDPEFHSSYRGPLSLSPDGEIRETVSTTLFLGRRLWQGAELYVDPEITQGKGLSNSQGVAGFPNGEATHAGLMQSSLLERYFVWNNLARAFLRQTFNLSGAYEHVDSDQNQLAGQQATSRVVISAGKMSASDIFDNNIYSHDPRTQFLNWGLMSNGAWDFPADAKGYTNGLTVEFIQPSYAIRWGNFMEPKAANGAHLDSNWGQWPIGEVIEGEKPYTVCDHPGKVRLLVFANHAHMGDYRDAINSSDVDITESRKYRLKYGAGLNVEQGITKDLGAFMRLGWNDGKTETWAFTEIDRTASLGLSLNGSSWSRVDDTVGLAESVNGLSRDHRDYLQAGGVGFIVGDGKLDYEYEKNTEIYYDYHLARGLTLTIDYQLLVDPGYNAARGPVSVFSGRLHYEF